MHTYFACSLSFFFLFLQRRAKEKERERELFVRREKMEGNLYLVGKDL